MQSLILVYESMKEYDSASSILLGYAESTYKDFTKSIMYKEKAESGMFKNSITLSNIKILYNPSSTASSTIYQMFTSILDK